MEEVEGSNPSCSTIFMKKHKYKNLEEAADFLPKHSYSIRNVQMEPVTLIVIGTKRTIRKAFKSSGWYQAVPIDFISSIRSALTTLLDRSYKEGPMWPSFINGKRHQLGFEKPTKGDTYRRRHHLRLWRTGYSLKNYRIWVGTLSYDKGTGFFPGTLLPTHHISPDLKREADFLAHTMNIARPRHVKLSEPEQGVINTGDPYSWDGKALVLDLSR
jgi:hypothetical protein